MNRSDIKFKRYTPTPNDQYHLGIVEVAIYDKIIMRFKHVKTKDGKGDFYAAPSYTLTDGPEKRYLQAFMLDSRSDDDMLQDVMREGVRHQLSNSSVHGMPAQSIQTTNTTSIEQLPF